MINQQFRITIKGYKFVSWGDSGKFTTMLSLHFLIFRMAAQGEWEMEATNDTDSGKFTTVFVNRLTTNDQGRWL